MKRLFCWFIASSLPFGVAVSRASAQDFDVDALRENVRKVLDDPNHEASKMLKDVLGKNGGNAWFYMPLGDNEDTPKRHGYAYDDVHFVSSGGAKLHGWFLKAKGEQVPLGTVVFSHGNGGAMGYHIDMATWLADAGYQVLMYDYRGFGSSKGEISRRGVVDDVKAAFAYVRTRKDVDGSKLFSVGHSLGGAKSIVALAETPVRGLRGVVTMGAFASYREEAAALAGSTGASLVTDELSPKDFVGRLGVPYLMVHGDKDEVVPVAQGRELLSLAKQPKMGIIILAGRHMDMVTKDGGKYRKQILSWMKQQLEK